ncbi:hypothetical protein ACP70R_040871 [Stipagrostis hirtigluma subsp. patula]
MSIRALTSLLDRRLSRARAPAGRLARSLHHTLVSPRLSSASPSPPAAARLITRVSDPPGGYRGTSPSAAVALSVRSPWQRSPDWPGRCIRRETDMIQEADVKESFNNNGDDIPWDKVIEDVEALVAAKKRARRDRYWSAIASAINKVAGAGAGAGAGREPLTEDEIKEEAAMKARFEDWMEEHGRTYKNEREKARRYEIFKAHAKMVDIANAKAKAGKGGACFVTNGTADWTDDEFRDRMCGGEFPYEDYLDHIKSFAAKKKALRNKEVPHSSKAI